MSALKPLLAALILVISTPVYASEENTLRVENITSVSDIIDSHFFSLAKTAKIDKLQVIYFGMWSYDGSRLLIKQVSQLPGTAGLTAVYLMNADGTEIKEIASTLNNTKSKPLDMNLQSWSHDGNRIVIITNIPRVRQFHVIADPDGSLFRVVGKNFTTIDSIRENILNIGWQNDFTWSPDGTKAFVIMDLENSGKQQLYTVDENGFILKQLTNESIETSVWNTVWSHDGKKIAFNGKSLWVINEDGTGLKKLAEDGIIRAGTISWSPDDSKIVYQSGQSVRTINVDGTGATEIISSDNRTDDTFSWSPDRQKILFTASAIYDDGKRTIRFYVADSDGRNQKLLSEVTSRDGVSASWSPKGDKIALIENNNLYTINPDGSGRATIALSLFNYAWNPSGDYIAFSSAIDKMTGKDVDHSIFWPKEESFTKQVSISKPEGTDRVQITINDTRDYNLNSWSPDGSRLLVDSFGNNLLAIKFSGYDEVMSLHVPSSVQQGEEFAIQVKSMSKPVENATIFLNSKTNENSFILLNGMEIGATNETGFLKYSFREAGNYKLSAAKQGFRSASKSITIQERLPEHTDIASPAPQITESTAATPKAPGFDAALAIAILSTIHLFKRRYN